MDTRNKINRKISVAPMMDCTDRHDRYFLRLMSKNVMLYSEMVATKSAIHGDRKKILSFSPEEKPLALQVGGSNKEELSEVAKIAEDMGYDEININLGCPSKKVQKNKFGACLMKEPELVAECINSMVNSCKIPVTAKTRIGFDDVESFEYLNNFINKMHNAGTKTFILHARKAMLTGLSPKQNLNIPKLNYNMVYEIKKENPVKFIETFLFQYLNPKGVSVAIIVVSTYVELGVNYINYATQVIVLAFLFSSTSITLWTFIGKFLRKFATNEKFIKHFN